jgi:hypothetical protein
MNWKGRERKWPWTNLRLIQRYLHGRIEERHEKISDNVKRVSALRFEVGAARIGSRMPTTLRRRSVGPFIMTHKELPNSAVPE